MTEEFEIIEYESLQSTQQTAKDLALQEERPWTIVYAKMQQGGHGKDGSHWHSPIGGLYFSIILPKEGLDDLQVITILAAFAVSKVLKDKFQIEPLIKLPNDVYLNNKKICGILTENVFGQELKCSVLGIGVNLNNRGFPEDILATSIQQETGIVCDEKEILNLIIKEIKDLFKTITK